MTLQDAARAFLKQYPSPRALRIAAGTHEDQLRQAGLLTCPYIADNGQGARRETLGYWLDHGGLSSRQIHAAITALAKAPPVLKPHPSTHG
jgi:hypothetical protein